MTDTLNGSVRRVTHVTPQALEPALQRHFGRERQIAQFRCQSSLYASSHGLHEIDVTLDDGTVLELLVKESGTAGLLDAARQVRPPLLHHPDREFAMYESVLSTVGNAVPTYYGILTGHRHAAPGLIMRRIDGLELRRVGEFACWKQAVRELAALHVETTDTVACLNSNEAPPLLEYNAEFYWAWPIHAMESVERGNPPWPREARVRMMEIVRRYGEVVDYLLSLPVAVIHGDCFPSNVLLETRSKRNRLYFVDWELAASGPGLVDVAALTTGNWTEDQRKELICTYMEALEASALSAFSFDEMLRAIDFCHLHLAMQLLGWSPDWTPPTEQAQDWFSEALRLTEKLGI